MSTLHIAYVLQILQYFTYSLHYTDFATFIVARLTVTRKVCEGSFNIVELSASMHA